MKIIELIKERLLYDPYRAVLRSKNIRMGNSKLGPGFRVRFDRGRDDISLEIGDRCVLHNQFVFESPWGKVTVGDGVLINGGTMIQSRSSVQIGNSVMISWGCTISDHDSHSISYVDRIADHDQRFVALAQGVPAPDKDWSRVATAPIKICDNSWLGFETIVLKGVVIGEGAIVGARSVVTRDLPPWTIAAGNPARPIKEIPLELRRKPQ